MGIEVRRLLAELRSARRAVCAELHALPPERMTVPTIWARAAADVRFMFLRYADHEEEHALQLARWLAEFGFTQTTAQRALGAAEMTRGDLLAVLVGLDDADLDRTPEGEWPLRRTLAHLIGAEQSYTVQTAWAVERFRSGLAWEAPPDDLLPPPLDESLAGSLADFLERLDAARERAITQLSDLPDEVLKAPTRWWNRDVSVEFRLQRFAHHEREHTAHILKWRQQVGRVPNEAEHLLGLAWRARGVLASQLVGLPDDLLDREAANNEGTIRQLLQHLIHSEQYITGQVRSAG
jgi:uncharacterized damage-inducible protein DinB